MSKILVCVETEKNDNINVLDVNNNSKSIDVKVFEYQPEKDTYAIIQTDYLGNIYIKQTNNNDDIYYIVSLDSNEDSGSCIELIRIKNPNIFRKNLEDEAHLKKSVRSGDIKASGSTLMGRAYETITDMTEEEREDYIIKNDFCSFDPGFDERKYFWVQYKDNDEPLEGEEDDGFYLNGISNNENETGIMYSDLLFLTPGTFDTLLIEGNTTSKNVVSTVERVDGYCTKRLTIYTSGHFRTNFIDNSKMARLCINPQTKELTMKKIK
jgi:hypothetical protein